MLQLCAVLPCAGEGARANQGNGMLNSSLSNSGDRAGFFGV